MGAIEPIPKLPENLRSASLRGTLIPFVGAGASRIAGCPDWSGFADQALQFFINQGKFSFGQFAQIRHLNPRVKLSIARVLEREHQVNIDYKKILYPSGQYNSKEGRDLYSHLSKLGTTFVTTNYDEWLDTSIEGPGPSLHPHTNPSAAPIGKPRTVIHKIDELTPGNLNRPNTVFHLHGAVREPDSMVLTTRDYVTHYANDHYRGGNGKENPVLRFLGHLFTHRNVLFVGYGLEELEILEYVIGKARVGADPGKTELKHFILQGFFSHEYELERSLRSYYRECGIELISFLRDQKDWGQLVDVLEEYARLAPAGPPLKIHRLHDMETFFKVEFSRDLPIIIEMMSEDEEYERLGFELFLKRDDFETFFDHLADSGLFGPSHNPAPVEVDKPGYFRVPYWHALGYLEAVARRATEQSNKHLARKVMDVVRCVSGWRDESGRARDNHYTFEAFTKILGIVPTSVVTHDDIKLIQTWLECRFDRWGISAALAGGVLEKFLASDEPDDWSKACRILDFCTAIRWPEDNSAPELLGPRGVAVVEVHQLKALIASSAAAFGKRSGKAAAEIFASRLRDFSARSPYAGARWMSRWAIEQQNQNQDSHDLEAQFVAGLRDILLSWVECDPTNAKPFVETLLRDELEIIRRIAIYVLNVRFKELRCSLLPAISPTFFQWGHGHELYQLLKTHFREFTGDEQSAVLAAIQNLPLPGSGEDAEHLRRSRQRQWLAAVLENGKELTDEWCQDLISDPTLQVSFPNPDFHTFRESYWAPALTPYNADALVALATEGTIIETLNGFVEPEAVWGFPATQSLANALTEAVGKVPSDFLSIMPSFRDAKAEYQAALIGGFKALWDAWDGDQGDFDWGTAWPKLIDFFESLLIDDASRSEALTEQEPLTPDPNWSLSVIADFLRAGTQDDKKAYSPELLPRTWPLIQFLLKKSERSHEPDVKNALNRAINTAGGKAIEALFNHALRRCRLSDSETGEHAVVWAEMEPIFDHEVKACENANFDFSALAGRYAANLAYLNLEWFQNNFGRIFAIYFPANCLSALQGLSYGLETPVVYKKLVDTGVLLWALDQSRPGDQVREALVQWMLRAYLWAQDELQSQQFKELFRADHLADLEMVPDFLWRMRGADLSDDQTKRILDFFEHAVDWAKTIDPLPRKLLSNLSLLACHIKTMGQREPALLRAVAPYVSVNYNAERFIEQLDRLHENNEILVADVFKELFPHYQPTHDFEDRLKNFIRKLAKNPATIDVAIKCANDLSDLPGMVQVYAQLIEPSPEGSAG